MAFKDGTIVLEDSNDILKHYAVALGRESLLGRLKGTPEEKLEQISTIQTTGSGVRGQFNAHNDIVSTLAIAMKGRYRDATEHTAMLRAVFESARVVVSHAPHSVPLQGLSHDNTVFEPQTASL